MNTSKQNLDLPNLGRRQKSASAVLSVLIILTVTMIAVGAALFEASHRYRTTHHSYRWAQAGASAEAGAEIALLTAQSDSWAADGWSGTPGAPGAAAVTKTVTLSTGVPGVAATTTSLSVDKVNMGGTPTVVNGITVYAGGSDWLRIRSTGYANASGGALAGIDDRDILLRKLSLRRNRITGATITTPQATRMIEVLAEPIAKSPYLRALLLDKKFEMSGGGWVDSFDSSDPAKSTNNLYDVAKRQSNGDIGVNDTQGASDLRNTFVYGDIAYSGPAIANTINVQGSLTTPFSEPVAPVLAPTWTTFNPTPTAITNSMTLTGGTKATPARYKVSSVNVPGGKVLTLAPHAAGQESYIELWVTGAFTTSGSGYITQQPGVHVTYHIAGDITVSGSSFNNQSNIAANNIVNAISPPTGTTRKVTVSGGGNFIGAINAPGADFTISGTANFSGSMIGKTMLISGGASVHYDEALSKFSGSGAAGNYRLASWVEAVR